MAFHGFRRGEYRRFSMMMAMTTMTMIVFIAYHAEEQGTLQEVVIQLHRSESIGVVSVLSKDMNSKGKSSVVIR